MFNECESFILRQPLQVLRENERSQRHTRKKNVKFSTVVLHIKVFSHRKSFDVDVFGQNFLAQRKKKKTRQNKLYLKFDFFQAKTPTFAYAKKKQRSKQTLQRNVAYQAFVLRRLQSFFRWNSLSLCHRICCHFIIYFSTTTHANLWSIEHTATFVLFL